MQRQLLSISGGGFSKQENSLLDTYLLNLVEHTEKKKICFISTASNDAQGYIDKFYHAFKAEEPCHIRVNDMQKHDIDSLLSKQDIIYVGGGNTQFMLTEWKKRAFDKALLKAYHSGVILAGMSAGAMCWFETCFSEKDEYTYEEFEGLAIIKGSFCPHYNEEIRRRQFDEWERTKINLTTYKLSDNEAIHFRNEEVVKVLDESSKWFF